MIQQVNLYQDSLRQGQAGTGMSHYSAGLIGIALLLMGISLYLLWSLGNLKTQMEQSHQSLNAEEARVAHLLSKLPKQENNASLADEIEQLQNRINELTQTLQLLTAKKSGATQGFSRHFQALADQSIPEVWLSKIHISGTQRIIDLEGSTFKPGQIPYFLQQLQKEPVFHGQTFAKLLMLKSEKIPGQIDFKLNTTLEPGENIEHHQ
jgi:hypothetical protein